jgi:hypothetical protein
MSAEFAHNAPHDAFASLSLFKNEIVSLTTSQRDPEEASDPRVLPGALITPQHTNKPIIVSRTLISLSC